MAMHERSILEAPVTPAPLFAYRALRGIFFTEPDSSPVQPAYNNNNIDDYDKENNNPNRLDIDLDIAKVRLSPIAVKLTPTNTAAQKRKRNGEDISDVLVSPTKSILRTPGVNTPRRAMLRDLNVKFMGDVRGGSLSPEFQTGLIKKNGGLVVPVLAKSAGKKSTELEAVIEGVLEVEQSAGKNRSRKDTDQDFARVIENDLLDINFEVEREVPKERKQNTQATQNNLGALDKHKPSQPSASTNPKPSVSTSTTPDFNFQTYITKTEKEMKRLIRYSQKMREYARKQDEENVKLKLMLEEVRKENSRLKRDLSRNDDRSDDVRVDEKDSRRDTGKASRSSKIGSTSSDAAMQAKIGSEVTRANLETYEDEVRTHTKRHVKDIPDRSTSAAKPISTSTGSSSSSGSLTITALPIKPSLKSTSNSEPENDKSTINHRQPLSKPHHTFSTTPSSSSRPESNIKPRHHSTTTHSATSNHPPTQTPQNTEPSTHPLSTLPSDRLAAARARVRQKAEARKASSESQPLQLQSQSQFQPQPQDRVLPRRNQGFNDDGNGKYESKTGAGTVMESGIGGGESILDWAGL